MGHEFSTGERRAGLRLIAVLESFRDFRRTMPLQYIVAFLHVALDEGKTIGEYALKAGVAPSVMSRHLLDIGARNRHMEPGFGLVQTKPNVLNLREHAVYLTEKGRSLFNKITRQLER